MNELSQLKCVACRAGEPTVTEAEIAELHPQIPEWQIVEVDGIKRLQLCYTFLVQGEIHVKHKRAHRKNSY